MKEKKSPYPDVFTGEFSEIFKEYVLIFLKLFQKLKIREHFWINILKPALPWYQSHTKTLQDKKTSSPD